MGCVCALSTASDPGVAVTEVVERVLRGLDGHAADLAFVFATRHHRAAFRPVSTTLRERGIARHVVGCTGDAVAGEDRQIDGAPALSVWAVTLPGVGVQPFRMRSEIDFAGWPSAAGDTNPSALILFADPDRFVAPRFRMALDERTRALCVPEKMARILALDDSTDRLCIMGGSAGGGRRDGRHRLVLDDRVFRTGAVGVRLTGRFALRTVVSQGCRPIGCPYIVTDVDEDGFVRELGGLPARAVLEDLLATRVPGDLARVEDGFIFPMGYLPPGVLAPDDRAHGQEKVLLLGRAINAHQESFGRGDFQIGTVICIDEAGGVNSVLHTRVGQTVQFHVRDINSADEDLRILLEREKSERPGVRRLGALLFSASSRRFLQLGESLSHEVSLLREILGPIPVAGFFGRGQFGPLGGQNCEHGYTASIALFEDYSGE